MMNRVKVSSLERCYFLCPLTLFLQNPNDGSSPDPRAPSPPSTNQPPVPCIVPHLLLRRSSILIRLTYNTCSFRLRFPYLMDSLLYLSLLSTTLTLATSLRNLAEI